MKIPEKDKSGILSEDDNEYGLISNEAIIMTFPLERFEHWGYLVYSEITSKLIKMSLTFRDKISEN